MAAPPALDPGFHELLRRGRTPHPSAAPDLSAEMAQRRRLFEADPADAAASLLDLVGRSNPAKDAAAEHFLRARAIWEPYLSLLTRLGVKPKFSMARRFVYAERLRRYAPAPHALLEIGCGSGHFALFLAAQGLGRNFVLVDLPEMLPLTWLILSTHMPDANIRVGGRPEAVEDLTFWLLDPEDCASCESGCFDVALSFNTLGQMDQTVREGYLDFMYRAAAPSALLYTVDRRQLAQNRDGTRYDCNPLLFPFRPSDEILEWEPDPFQQNTRSAHWSAPTSFAISRVARVRKLAGVPGSG